MSNPSNDAKNFIDGIWRKTRYFEHLRKEEDKKINLLTIRKRKLKNLFAFSLGLILLTAVSAILEKNLAIASVSIYMMSFTLYYEYNFN